MPDTYTIGEFAEKYRFRDIREVKRYIALGVIKPMRVHGNSELNENHMMDIVKYNTQRRNNNE